MCSVAQSAVSSGLFLCALSRLFLFCLNLCAFASLADVAKGGDGAKSALRENFSPFPPGSRGLHDSPSRFQSKMITNQRFHVLFGTGLFPGYRKDSGLKIL
jgi:hypothetical protein